MCERRFGVWSSKAGLGRIKPFGHQGREPQHVKPKSGIARIAQHREPIDKQALHAPRITHRRAGAKLDAVHFAVNTKQRNLEKPRAFAPPLQHAIEITCQLSDGAKHIGFEPDRLGKASLHHRYRNRKTRPDRLIFKTQRLVETTKKLCTKTSGERRTRAFQYVPDQLETDLPQGIGNIRRKPKRRQR